MNMDLISMVDYLAIVKHILNLNHGNIIIKHDTSKLEGTHMGITRFKGRKITIFLRDDYDKPYVEYFAVAHELRHIWQYISGFSLDDYKERSELSVDQYNKQFLEIDANAFAQLMLSRYLHIMIDLPILLTDDIQKRMKIINADLFRSE